VASTSAAAASGSSEEVISGQKVAVQAAEKVNHCPHPFYCYQRSRSCSSN